MDNNRKSRMPVVFVGHGSPMVALEDSEITRSMAKVGADIVSRFGKPKAILAISAHWYVKGTLIQSSQNPRQIYDMYGFPRQLYELKYQVSGNAELTARVHDLLGDKVMVNDMWGIDHGSWSVLVHMFPKADVPVVQLSVDATLSSEKAYELGEALSPLRDEGYLILASGNLVHNLRLVEWNKQDGTPMAHAFNDYIVGAIASHEYRKVIGYQQGPSSSYAVPIPDHYMPLVYALGASDGDEATLFNNVCNLGSICMTSFVFG